MTVAVNGMPLLALLPAFLLGAGLGLLFFTALWLTVRQLPRSAHPVPLLIGSGLARLAVALPAFYLIGAGHWQRVAAALAGFLLARTLLLLRWRPPALTGRGDGDGPASTGS